MKIKCENKEFMDFVETKTPLELEAYSLEKYGDENHLFEKIAIEIFGCEGLDIWPDCINHICFEEGGHYKLGLEGIGLKEDEKITFDLDKYKFDNSYKESREVEYLLKKELCDEEMTFEDVSSIKMFLNEKKDSCSLNIVTDFGVVGFENSHHPFFEASEHAYRFVCSVYDYKEQRYKVDEDVKLMESIEETKEFIKLFNEQNIKITKENWFNFSNECSKNKIADLDLFGYSGEVEIESRGGCYKGYVTTYLNDKNLELVKNILEKNEEKEKQITK